MAFWERKNKKKAPGKRVAPKKKEPQGEVIDAEFGPASSGNLPMVITPLTPVQFNDEQEKFKEFVELSLVPANFEKGIEGDYGYVPGINKRFLLKGGADKIAKWGNYSVRYEVMTEIEDVLEGVYFYKMKSILYRPDRIVEGIGTCSSLEDKYRWRWFEATKEEDEQARKIRDREGAHAFSEAGYKWRVEKVDGRKVFTVLKRYPGDAHSIANTIVKMAEKRAFVAAAITAASASELFTQDPDVLEADAIERELQAQKRQEAKDLKSGKTQPPPLPDDTPPPYDDDDIPLGAAKKAPPKKKAPKKEAPKKKETEKLLSVKEQINEEYRHTKQATGLSHDELKKAIETLINERWAVGSLEELDSEQFNQVAVVMEIKDFLRVLRDSRKEPE